MPGMIMGKNILNTDLIYEVLSVVEEIPEGRVATYGQVARFGIRWGIMTETAE